VSGFRAHTPDNYTSCILIEKLGGSVTIDYSPVKMFITAIYFIEVVKAKRKYVI
jgi:hypothetical protein